MVVRIVLKGGTNSLRSSGTNCLRSSWWGLWWYEYVLIILVVFLVVQIVLDHLSGVCVTSWYE